MTVRKATTTKAPAKKAPAKKPAVKAAPKAAAAKVETLAAVMEAPHQTVTVKGRPILVKMPTVEQLMAWEKVISTISDMHLKAVDYESIRTQTDRFYRITESVFVNQADKDWMEEARLDGEISIADEEILGLMAAVTKVFEEYLPGAPQNRAAKRAAARKKA